MRVVVDYTNNNEYPISLIATSDSQRATNEDMELYMRVAIFANTINSIHIENALNDKRR